MTGLSRIFMQLARVAQDALRRTVGRTTSYSWTPNLMGVAVWIVENQNQPERKAEMDPNNGTLYPSLADARAAGVKDAVEISGTPEAVQRVSDAVKAQRKVAKRKAQKRARRANR